MLRCRDEEDLQRCGIGIDPNDPTRALPIKQLADRQQGPTCPEGAQGDAPQGRLDGQDGPMPAGSEPTTTEKAQAAPFDLEARISRIAGLQRRALKHDRFCTVLYCRSGLQLIEVKKAFRSLGRRDFCGATERQGIQPWFRKRAMAIGRYFRTEEACKGIPLLEALKMSRKQPAGEQQRQTARGGRNGRPSRKPAPRKSRPPVRAAAPAGDPPGGGNAGGEPITAGLYETLVDEVSQEAVEAAATLVGTAGGYGQAASALVRQAAKDGDKKSAKDILRGTVAAARSVLTWGEINEVVQAAELRANGAKAREV
jgi:hypothetical protein